MPGSTLSRGNMLNEFIIGPTLTPVATAANTVAEQNFTIPGLQATDVAVGWSVNFAFTSSVVVNNCRVSAPNILTISFANGTGGALTFPSGQWFLIISRPENVPVPTNAF